MTLALHSTAHACGKIILLGEHAVVHGQPALAAGLPDALTLHARELDDRRAPIRLSIPAWDLVIALDGDSDHPVARACLEVLAHCDGPITGWAIDGIATIPARAGLGSSAALTVALARLVLGRDADHDDVVQASLAGERVFHGTPSGIDTEVAAKGGVLRYVRGEPAEAIALRHPLPLVVVPSGVPRSTADQVAKVHRAVDRWPMLARPMIELVGRLVDLGQDAMIRGDLPRLGELADLDHALLTGLGVSSWILDELCYVARGAGALGAKLTGAGGGGCILALPGSDPTPLLAAFEHRQLRPLCFSIGTDELSA
jgi:mevalonate kinase